jgi:hypothetical protein
MPRRKVVKTAKVKKLAIKRQVKTAASGLADSLEKSFREIPAKIIAQTRKELSTIKQQEAKLKTEQKKAQAQKKITKTKHMALTAKAKSKPSPTTKKQLVSAKQAFDKVSKTIAGIDANLAVVKKQVDTLSKKNAKFTALSKQISSFDKEWERKGKTPKKSKSTKPATKSTSAAKTRKQKVSEPETEFSSTLRDLINTPDHHNVNSPNEVTE